MLHLKDRKCEACGEPYHPARKKQRFCSQKCRQDDYRKRLREDANATRRRNAELAKQKDLNNAN